MTLKDAQELTWKRFAAAANTDEESIRLTPEIVMAALSGFDIEFGELNQWIIQINNDRDADARSIVPSVLLVGLILGAERERESRA